MLVDVHAHMDQYKDQNKIDDVVKKAKENKFVSIISNGIDLESNKKVLELSKKYPIIKPALGFYPVVIDKSSEGKIKETLKFIEENESIAVGEVGLDLHYGKKLEKQKEVLSKLIKIANKKDIPVIVHSRKAEKETVEFLEQEKPKKVLLHCFSGNAELTKKAVEEGWMFSIPTSIVRNKTFKKLAKRVPLSQILTETDAPFLSPYEDNKINEPSFIKESIKKIAEVKGITEEELEKAIYENYQKFFKH